MTANKTRVFITRTSLLLALAAPAWAARSGVRPDKDSLDVPAQVTPDDELEASTHDAALDARIRLALLDALGVDALDIAVTSRSGKVDLEGTVTRRQTHELAADIVRDIEGVDSVDSRIDLTEASQVRPLNELMAEVQDGALQANVRLHLLDVVGSKALGVSIDVANGLVVLSGEVPDLMLQQHMVEAAMEVEGVSDVQNNMRLAPTLEAPKPMREPMKEPPMREPPN